VHVILRGGSKGPNFASEHVKDAIKTMEKARPKSFASVMIDCSRQLAELVLVMGDGVYVDTFQMETHKRTTTINPRWSTTFASSSLLATKTLLV
jgi:hypothetical protein